MKGKCKKCGKCCRTIVFAFNETDYIINEKQFEILKNWDKKYNNFYISGKDENGRLLFTCKALGDNNECKKYFFRSLYCRKYPFVEKGLIYNGVQPDKDCGYYFEPEKPFSDFME